MPDQNKRQAVDSGIKEKPGCWCHNKTKEMLLVYWTKIRTLPCLVHPSKTLRRMSFLSTFVKVVKKDTGIYLRLLHGFVNHYTWIPLSCYVCGFVKIDTGWKVYFLQLICCIPFAQTRQCEQWLIRKWKQLHTCPKKEKKMAFVHRIWG